MAIPERYGLEQARIQLPHIVAEAHAGFSSVITKHGKPYAAVVPVSEARARKRAGENFFGLRGTGKGLYGNVARHVDALRREWD